MISVIVPAYNEASNLGMLWNQLRIVFDQLADESFECIIVDDGSSDDSIHILEELRQEDARLCWIKLAKNSGSHDAIGHGLRVCRGSAAIVLAADLQDPPGVFRDLIRRWRAGAKVAWAVRESRPGERWMNRIASRLYYWVMNLILPTKFPSTGADFFLADRQAVELLARLYKKHSPNVLFQVASLGLTSDQILYTKQKRYSGKSKWSLSKRIYLFSDSVLAFSPAGFLWVLALALILLAGVMIHAGAWPAAAVPCGTLFFCAWRSWALANREPAAVGRTCLNSSADRDPVNIKETQR